MHYAQAPAPNKKEPSYHRYAATLLSTQLLPNLDATMSNQCELACKALCLRMRAHHFQPFNGDNEWLELAELDKGQLYNDKIVETIVGITQEGIHQNSNVFQVDLSQSDIEIYVIAGQGYLRRRWTRNTNRLMRSHPRNGNRILHRFVSPFYIESFGALAAAADTAPTQEPVLLTV